MGYSAYKYIRHLLACLFQYVMAHDIIIQQLTSHFSPRSSTSSRGFRQALTLLVSKDLHYTSSTDFLVNIVQPEAILSET